MGSGLSENVTEERSEGLLRFGLISLVYLQNCGVADSLFNAVRRT
jgi:hypothetical protein